ncbi:hypothetical protein HYPBUDRAFT_112050 [Hyphopichia burtonii NRRL Y-1933]|uniref:Amino acid permease/ SLC12A domain-containing protein n=1 Tax=Hyphopichia burtonii NRRL Y-1933 TaxID=984485 RepID=A0A1E4RF68_9ASCO|nr:hypothetical protein HYPBUDRAFT_112050 [Hyphopichia burtonii NRRL Y-1933]ODV65890.1 hypothetical protein HYPBUDRAFT_112050 [Hyphopichia burtonii NRRL Y-1933]
MFLCYIVVGVCCLLPNQLACIETTCLFPTTSGYVIHANHFCDEALSFTMGYLDIWSNIIPNETAAIPVIISYWDSHTSPAVYIAVFGVLIAFINCWNIKFYGEFEFVAGTLKMFLVTLLVIVGLVIDLGGAETERLGFHYWKVSPFIPKYTTGNLGKFAAFWKALSSVVYAYGGVQGICLLCGETEYPRRTIYRTGKRVFVRVLSLYLSAVLIVTMIANPRDPKIANSSGNATSSPFVVSIQRAGIKVLPHIINAIVLSSAFSAANLQLLKVSRTLFALAGKKQAPKIFLKVNRHGIPYVGVGFACLFLSLAFMSVSSGSSTVFSWFQNITSSNILISWCLIAFNHIMMTRAMKAQGYSRDMLPYKFKGGQYCSWISLFFSMLFLLTGGFPCFIKGNFEFSELFTAYFVIPLAFCLYVFWKLLKRTKFRKATDVDLKLLFQDVEDKPEPPFPKITGWRMITYLWD